MKRLSVVALLVLALTGSAARADVFAVVPSTPAAAPLVLPSAETPNTPDSLLLPAGWTQSTPVPATLDYAALQSIWQRAGASYGIRWQVLAAINKIESNFGRNMGPSSAGAVGWMQFMPSTWLRWGMDGDGDRVADPWDPEDGIFSAARYLAAAGGATDIRRAVFAYNHADWYVNDVLDTAELFAGGAQDTGFTLDRYSVDLQTAQLAVAHASEALTAARKLVHARAKTEAKLLALVPKQQLFSDQLAAQKRAALAGFETAAAARRVADLRAQLAEAEQALEEARLQSQQAAFAPAAGTLLAAASYSGDYVFPVGGGPGVVHVGATHHDYPAADIGAPEGAPLYALANGVVRNAWTYPDPRCGIGFTIATADGLLWTYCHLSYLDPSVQTGVSLQAGAPVGLVGSTGHASGPHLHLQLQPATAFPQQQAWFQSFAGTAFRWDGPPPPLAAPVADRSRDVFGGSAEDGVVLFHR
jgi:murein DD-endopeptidase MepM/ murein hydrolase activator NlpD